MMSEEEKKQEWEDIRLDIEVRKLKSDAEASRVLLEAGWKIQKREHILGNSAYVFHPATGQIICFDLEDEDDQCLAIAAINYIKVYKEEEWEEE